MKRLSQPSEPMPEAYMKEEDKPVSHAPSSVSALMAEEKLKDIPPSSVYNYNLKKMSSFKQIRRKYKMSNQKSMFIHDLKLVLGEYKPSNHDLDSELLTHILNIAEQFFIYGSKEEREGMKEDAVKTLMLNYFRDDELLLNKFIGQVWPKVKKSNMFKRSWSRLVLFLKL